MKTIPERLNDLEGQLKDALARLEAQEKRPAPVLDTSKLDKAVSDMRAEFARISQNADQVSSLDSRLKTAEKALADATPAPDLTEDLLKVEERVTALEKVEPVQAQDYDADIQKLADTVQQLQDNAPADLSEPLADLQAQVKAMADRPLPSVDLSGVLRAVNEARELLGLPAAEGSEPAPATPTMQASPPAQAELNPAADAALNTLPERTRNLLTAERYTTDASIAAAPDEDLLSINGIGTETLKTIRAAIPAAQKDGKA